ncbi:MAG: hypothetical protein ACREUG_15775, partial [Steroidobacteraceae bacterium]
TESRHESAGQVPRPDAPQGATCDEAQLFPEAPRPRYFGEGSYVSGGPTAEGNYALPDPNPRGGYGCFDDAGGVGSTRLLGESGIAGCEPKKEPPDRDK